MHYDLRGCPPAFLIPVPAGEVLTEASRKQICSLLPPTLFIFCIIQLLENSTWWNFTMPVAIFAYSSSANVCFSVCSLKDMGRQLGGLELSWVSSEVDQQIVRDTTELGDLPS